MEKSELIIGVHSNGENDTEAKGLAEAFSQNGIKALSIEECEKENLIPNLTIGMDTAGISNWQKYLNKNITNIMWSTDSVFVKNYQAIEQFAKMPNFVLLTSTPCDTEPVGRFFTTLKHGALILGANPLNIMDFTGEKEYDFLFSSDIIDIDAKIADLKASMPEFVYKMMMEMYKIGSDNPVLSFWQIYKLFCENLGLSFDYEQYLLLFSHIAPLITSNKKIQLIKAMKDFDVKVAGNDVWKKYIEGNIEYIGLSDVSHYKKAKIVLHYQSIEMGMGLEKGLLEACESGAMIFSSKTPSIESIFGPDMEYFDPIEFKNIAQQAQNLLSRPQECRKRAEKVLESLKTVNSLKNRVAEIIGLIK